MSDLPDDLARPRRGWRGILSAVAIVGGAVLIVLNVALLIYALGV